MNDINLPPLPKSAKAQRTRLKILEAARAVFAERGFAKATAEEISTKAGVGYGTFYLYFTDKRQALHTILAEVDDKLYEPIDLEKNRIGLGALATIRATITSFFDSFKEYSDILKICHELSATDSDFKTQHDKVRLRLVNRIKEHIKKGLEHGNARNVDPEISSIAIAGLIETIANEWFFNNHPWDREKVIETVCRLYYSAVVK